MGGQDVDDRPWFQVIKRRKSVVDTLNQENILNSLDSNSERNSNYHERMETATPFEYRVRDDNQRSRSNNDKHSNAITAAKQDITDYEDAVSPKQQGSFRSGLQLLIESEI